MATARGLAERSRRKISEEKKEEKEEKEEDEEQNDDTMSDEIRQERKRYKTEPFFGGMPLSSDLVRDRQKARDKLMEKTGLTERDLQKLEDDFSMIASTFAYLQLDHPHVSHEKKMDGWEVWVAKHFPKHGTPKMARKVYDIMNDEFRKFIGTHASEDVRKDFGVSPHNNNEDDKKEGLDMWTIYLLILTIVDIIAAILGLIPGFGAIADGVGILASVLSLNIFGIIASIVGLIPGIGMIGGIAEVVYNPFRAATILRRGRSAVKTTKQTRELQKRRSTYRSGRRGSSPSSSRRRSSSRSSRSSRRRGSASSSSSQVRRPDRRRSRRFQRSRDKEKGDDDKTKQKEPTTSELRYREKPEEQENDWDVTSQLPPDYYKRRRVVAKKERKEDEKMESKKRKREERREEIQSRLDEISEFRDEQEERNRVKRRKLNEELDNLKELKDEYADDIKSLQKEKDANRDDLDTVNDIRDQQRKIHKERERVKKDITKIEDRLGI